MEKRKLLNQKTIQRLEIALARKSFYDYCRIKIPKVYEDCDYLEEICNEMQDFLTNDLELLIINMPPRHAKTLTKDQFAAWCYGRNKNIKLMNVSYNQSLSRKSSKFVRNSILEKKSDEEKVMYTDIFPLTKIEYGSASVDMWKIDGSYTDSYLATSPGGTITGIGADIIMIDDIIKNSYEAFHVGIKDEHYEFFTDTLYSRLEGLNKVLLVMTRWATDDLAGRLIDLYTEQGRKFKVISKKACDNGVMLNPKILSLKRWELIKQTIGEAIANANYNQEPADIKGRLYGEFKTYEELPNNNKFIFCLCDPADEGKDFLASVVYTIFDEKAFVMDIIYTDKPLEITEPLICDQIVKYGVDEWIYEKNFGGKSFGKNIKRQLEDREYYTSIQPYTQTQNKQARIYSNSTNVMRQIVMPKGWEEKFPEVFKHLSNFSAEGTNEHDDIEDVLTKIVELINS